MIALLGVHFTQNINLGTILSVVVIVATLLGLWRYGYGARWRAAYEAEHAAAQSLADGRDAFQKRAERVEAELKESTLQREESLKLIGELKETIAKLEALPNLQEILQTFGEMSVREDAAASKRTEAIINVINERFSEHEQHAQERHEAQMDVAQAMVDKLNGRTKP